MTVGERIKEIRERLEMSQVDFADKINVSKQTLYKYENNLITNIPSDKIEAAAKIGNVSPAYLMGWDVCQINTCENEDSRTKRLLTYFNALSDIGKKKALDNIEDLSKIYSVNEPLLNAAHERTDIEVTDEMKKHDDEIMDDDNF